MATNSPRTLADANERKHTTIVIYALGAMIIAHLGRFLPRLGPFTLSGLLFWSRGGQPQEICPRVHPDLQIMQLSFVRCTFNYCGAVDGRRVRLPQPSLGVSSLDLGRSVSDGLFFCPLPIPILLNTFQYSPLFRCRADRHAAGFLGISKILAPRQFVHS